MKRQQIYDFAIDNPLTLARRKALEKHLQANIRLSPRPVSWNWDKKGTVLHIAAAPVEIDVKFNRKNIELYAAAPLWARLLFTAQKKDELKRQIEAVLVKTKLVATRKTRRPVAARARKPTVKTPRRSYARA